jgi:hypothetical protein
MTSCRAAVAFAVVFLCAASLFLFIKETENTENTANHLRPFSFGGGGVATSPALDRGLDRGLPGGGGRRDIRVAMFCLERSGSTWYVMSVEPFHSSLLSAQ